MSTHTLSPPSFPSLPAVRPVRSRPEMPALRPPLPTLGSVVRVGDRPAPRPLLDRVYVGGVFVLLALMIVAAFTSGCAGRTPPTRYYDLASPPMRTAGGGPVIALDLLNTDDAYDDERIVYRTSPYRLDYYDYHRWSASPGVMIGNYLERGLESSGLFAGVVRETTRDVGAVLAGRVVALEEVDVTPKAWQGHLVLELRLLDPRTGEVLWAQQYEERQPLAKQSPEGLAEAISTAMARIVERAAPAIHDTVAEHVAASGR